MKKLLLPVLLILFYSCTKNPPAIPNPSDAPDISAVPSEFVQKIVIENFTQTTCGQCPKASLTLDSLVSHNPNRVYGVSFHIGDAMMDSALNVVPSGGNYYDVLFNPSGIYPSGLVNRVASSVTDLSPDGWAFKVLGALGRTPACGIAIDAKKINGNKLNLTVHVGFSAVLAGDYRIHTYIVENYVRSSDSLYDQLNDFSINGLTPDSLLPQLYLQDDTIHLYKHNYVLRRVVSPGGLTGTPIPQAAMVRGNDYPINFDVSLDGINAGNSSVLVFVDKYATTGYGHWIENVQMVPIGESKDWN
jgi:hypothetical protein